MSAGAIIAILFALLILTGVGLFCRRVRLDLREERRRGLNRGAAAQVMPDDRAKAFGAAGKGCLGAIPFAFGPTLLFVLTYGLAPVPAGDRIYVASAALAVAVLALVLFRLAKPLPKGPSFPWRNLLIIAFAGLTVALHDDLFVKLRPTVTNLIAASLAVGSILGLSGPLGGMVDRNSMPLDDSGWRKFAAAFAAMGIGMAGLNEYVRRFQSEAFWVYFQLWGPALYCVVLLVFGFLIVKKHGPVGKCPAKLRAEQSEPSNDQ